MAKVAKKPVQKNASPAKVKKPAQAIARPGQKKPAAKPRVPETANSAKGLATSEEMVICQAVDRKGEPVMIEKWRYDLLKQAILNVVPADDIGLMYKQLTPAVRANLSREDRKRIGQLHHDTTLVKLDLEYHGELERIEGMRPQYLRRVAKASKSSLKKKTLNRE
jgi:hypothetical protein